MRKFKVKLADKEYTVEVEEVDEFVFDQEKTVKKEEKKQATKVKAPLSGVVQEINIKEGKLVQQGSKMISLEAMKMEHTVKAPITGVVKEINVVEGANVEAEDILIIFE